MGALDEMYHNCRWCHFNDKGKCIKSTEVFESCVAEELYQLAEGGKLSEAIKEGLKFPKMRKLESLLDSYGISQKRQKEILQAVEDELEEFSPTIVESVDNSVSQLILNVDPTVEDLELRDPESFYCKHFM